MRTTAVRSLLVLLVSGLLAGASYSDWKEIPYGETAPEPTPTAAETERGFILFSRPITEPVYPNTRPLSFERITSLEAFAAAGEFEPFVFTVYPLKDIAGMAVSVSPLMSGAVPIPASNIEVRYARHTAVRFPLYTSKGTFRRMPELLEKSETHSFPAGECRQFWLTVRVPETAKPGIYKGTVSAALGGIVTEIPVSLRVVAFTLSRDPSKQYTAYHYDIYQRHKNTIASLDPALTNAGGLARIAANEYNTMRDYGFTMAPTIYLGYASSNNSFYVRVSEGAEAMRTAGLLNAPYLLAVMPIGGLYQKYTGSWTPPHALVTNTMPDEFYRDITAVTKRFEAERAANKWPPFYYNPLDEVDAAAREFGVRVHEAVKAAGVKVYTTKDPKAPDASYYRNCIDLWCSQPFSVSYEEASRSSAVKYWSYPNHNSGEIKSREVMMKGGRMTYGYGFWRSGYEGLVPWMWRWDVDDPADYLDGRAADTGFKLTRSGELNPAVYWECFREGVDDARYIYTLEEALVQREKNSDTACRALVTEGKKFIGDLWHGIKAEDKYLADGMWPSEDFNGLRWNMVRLIGKLMQFPADTSVKAPSVLVTDTAPRAGLKKPSVFDEAQRTGNLEMLPLGIDDFSAWTNSTKEGVLETVTDTMHGGSSALRWTVTIDHQNDGGEGGKYHVGWPRMRVPLETPVDLAAYDYVSLWLMIDSDRDEVADDTTPFTMDIYTSAGKFARRIVNEAEQRRWMHILVPSVELASIAGGAANLTGLKALQFWIGESAYKHGTKLKFYLDDIALVRFRNPVIESVSVPAICTLPAVYVPASFVMLGGNAVERGRYSVRASLLQDNRVLSFIEQDLIDFKRIGIPADRIRVPGQYDVTVELRGGDQVRSSVTTQFTAVEGPFFGVK
ncbi:MAG: hypothetical protein HZC28_20350 [Spirochaetes bacterium]|nr:hypothetical protein [Spirochaetota bacterium]